MAKYSKLESLQGNNHLSGKYYEETPVIDVTGETGAEGIAQVHKVIGVVKDGEQITCLLWKQVDKKKKEEDVERYYVVDMLQLLGEEYVLTEDTFCQQFYPLVDDIIKGGFPCRYELVFNHALETVGAGKGLVPYFQVTDSLKNLMFASHKIFDIVLHEDMRRNKNFGRLGNQVMNISIF